MLLIEKYLGYRDAVVRSVRNCVGRGGGDRDCQRHARDTETEAGEGMGYDSILNKLPRRIAYTHSDIRTLASSPAVVLDEVIREPKYLDTYMYAYIPYMYMYSMYVCICIARENFGVANYLNVCCAICYFTNAEYT